VSRPEIVRKDGWWRPVGDALGASHAVTGAQTVPHFLNVLPPARRGLCIQAGGNVGAYPIALAKRFAKVTTFEPDYSNFAALWANVAERDPDGLLNIEMVAMALWEGPPALAKLRQVETGNCGTYRLVVGKGKIPCASLDDFTFNDRIDLIWLDVEGAELPALRGAKAILAGDHPAVIVELKGHGRHYGYEDEDVGRYLATFGYALWGSIDNDYLFMAPE